VREHRWQLSLDCPESAFHVQIKVKVAGSQATSNGLSHPQSSVLLAIFQWCASDYGCWALRIYENENDGCHGHQIGPKQPKAKANKSRWVGPQRSFRLGWVGKGCQCHYHNAVIVVVLIYPCNDFQRSVYSRRPLYVAATASASASALDPPFHSPAAQ